jgi:hypothetical protein
MQLLSAVILLQPPSENAMDHHVSRGGLEQNLGGVIEINAFDFFCEEQKQITPQRAFWIRKPSSRIASAIVHDNLIVDRENRGLPGGLAQPLRGTWTRAKRERWQPPV